MVADHCHGSFMCIKMATDSSIYLHIAVRTEDYIT